MWYMYLHIHVHVLYMYTYVAPKCHFNQLIGLACTYMPTIVHYNNIQPLKGLMSYIYMYMPYMHVHMCSYMYMYI